MGRETPLWPYKLRAQRAGKSVHRLSEPPEKLLWPPVGFFFAGPRNFATFWKLLPW
jgi:hypothetical protein